MFFFQYFYYDTRICSNFAGSKVAAVLAKLFIFFRDSLRLNNSLVTQLYKSTHETQLNLISNFSNM